MLVLPLLASLAHGGDVPRIDLRLILVGDTGKEHTEVGPHVRASIDAELAGHPEARVLALGDLYYPLTPNEAGEACPDQLVARYEAFYGGLPPERVIAVAGNHDIHGDGHDEGEGDPEADRAAIAASKACVEAAFHRMGWLPEGAPLASRTFRIEAGETTAEILAVEGGSYGEGVDLTGLGFTDPDAWHILASHYIWAMERDKCDEQDGLNAWIRAQDPSWQAEGVVDLWMAGHAHLLSAVMAGDALAITSGGGASMRRGDRCRDHGTAPAGRTLFLHNGPKPSSLTTLGGWVRVDLGDDGNSRAAWVTPYVCRADGESGSCTADRTWRCGRDVDGRGVTCN